MEVPQRFRDLLARANRTDPRQARTHVHDPTYKESFSFPRMMEELVRAVSSRWARELDFSTLTRLSSEYISAGRTNRYGDMLWEAGLLDGRGSVLITLEFQNTVDREMPLRVLDYASSALLDWVRREPLARGDKAPLMLPIVVYGGRRPWGVPTRLADLLPPTPPQLLANQPLYEYFLLEERRGGTGGLPPGNLVTGLVGVVRARKKADLVGQLVQLHDWLGTDRDGALDRALTTWIWHLLSSLGPPGLNLGAVTTLKEVLEVIRPTGQWAVRWYEDGLDEGREQGIQQGREQGIQQGRSQGQASVLRRQAARKFGPDAEGILTELLDGVTDPEDIDKLAHAVVDCDNAEDFVGRVSRVTTR